MQYLRALCSRDPNTTGTTWVRHCHMHLISTLKSLYFANFSRCFLTTLPSSGQLMPLRKQVLAFLSLRHIRSVGCDLPCSGDGRIPYYHDVVRLHKPIRLMPVPLALHWNLEMPKNVPVDDVGDLIVSISEVPKSLVLSSHHLSLSCTRKVRILQPIKGLCHIPRRLLRDGDTGRA